MSRLNPILALALLACSRSPASSPPFVPAPGSPIAVGDAVGRPLLADVNGDARLDVVVTCSDGAGGGAVVVLLGDGAGGFRAVEPRVRDPAGGLKVAVGDVDADGAPDLAIAAHDRYDVALLRGDGAGRFTAWRSIATSNGSTPHVHSLALADLDGDRWLDLVVGHSEEGRVAVLRGDGAGRFAAVELSPFEAGRHPYEGLAACDLDRDGDLDVAVPDLLGDALIVLLGDGTGRLVRDAARPRPTGPRPGFLAAGDLDGDGALDVALTHDDEPLLCVLWSEPGSIATRATRLALPERAWGAVIADFDQDGRNDLALGEQGDGVTIFSGGAGEFPARRIHVDCGGRAPGNLAAGDVDGDGALDLVTGNYESGDVSVLLARRR